MCCIIDALHVSVKVVQLAPRSSISDSSPSATHKCVPCYVGKSGMHNTYFCMLVCSINNKHFTFPEHLRLHACIEKVMNMAKVIWLFLLEGKVTEWNKIIILGKHEANFFRWSLTVIWLFSPIKKKETWHFTPFSILKKKYSFSYLLLL